MCRRRCVSVPNFTNEQFIARAWCWLLVITRICTVACPAAVSAYRVHTGINSLLNQAKPAGVHKLETTIYFSPSRSFTWFDLCFYLNFTVFSHFGHLLLIKIYFHHHHHQCEIISTILKNWLPFIALLFCLFARFCVLFSFVLYYLTLKHCLYLYAFMHMIPLILLS